MKINITTIAIALVIILSIVSSLAIKKCSSNKQLVSEKETILSTKEKQFKNKLGENANEVKVWKLKYTDLEVSNSKISSERSEYEQKLAKAYSDIELYKRKNKDLISYQSSTITASDTLIYEYQNECFTELKPINSKHLKLEFIKDNGKLLIPYLYTTDINTLVTFTPKKKANGRKHFPNWGFIWGWETISITTVDDTSAHITNNVSIQFKR